MFGLLAFQVTELPADVPVELPQHHLPAPEAGCGLRGVLAVVEEPCNVGALAACHRV